MTYWIVFGAATDQFINILYTGSQYVIGSRDGATGGSAVFYSTTETYHRNTWTKEVTVSSSIDAIVLCMWTAFYVFTPGTGGARIYTATNIYELGRWQYAYYRCHAADAFMMGTAVIFSVLLLNIHMVQSSTDLTNFTLQPHYIQQPRLLTAMACISILAAKGIATANGSNWKEVLLGNYQSW